jgi:hypothetical protein
MRRASGDFHRIAIKNRAGVLGRLVATVMVATVAVVLMAAGSASASEGFTVENQTALHYKLSVQSVEGWTLGFDSRPLDGSLLVAGGTQRFELKSPYYAATITYRLSSLIDLKFQISSPIQWLNPWNNVESTCQFTWKGKLDGPFRDTAISRHVSGYRDVECFANGRKLLLRPVI